MIDSTYISIESGGWSDWKILSAEQCLLENSGRKVKRVRFCDSPMPRYGGDLCEDPEKNEDEISCDEIKNAGIYNSNQNSTINCE